MIKRNDIRTLSNSPLKGESMRLKRPIRPIRPMRLMGLMSLMALLVLLAACSEERVPEPEQVRPSVPVELMSFAKIFMDEDPDIQSAARRTPDWAPGGYKLYSELQDADATLMSNENAAIGVFFTQDAPTQTVVTRKFRYVGGTGAQWRMDEDLESTGEYYLYGYVPLDAASVSIQPDATTGNYADGARLTFTGLSSVMNKDVCVLVGAKEGASATSATTYEEVENVVPESTKVTGYYERSAAEPYTYTITEDTKAADGKTYYRKEDLATGKFDVKINVGANVHNNLFLLFDHIYSALSFRFKISSTYNQLRDIKLKKLELMAYNDELFTTKMKKNQSVTITLKATSDGSSPMPSKITFTPDNTSEDIGYVLIYENTENPYVLKTDNNEGMIGFVPRNANYFILRSTYDVYDKAGNLVRKDCVAENRINLPYLFNQDELKFGHRYIIRLFVEPTYLYQLSDPDLDNPTIKVVN
jgi:hypothetical protein